VPLAGFALASIAGREADTGLATTLAAFTALFAVVGFTQRPGTSVAVLPVAWVSMLAALPDASMASATESLLELVVASATGEAIALVLRRQHRAERGIASLLHAVRLLGHIDDRRAGATTTARLGAELLGADAAGVFLATLRHGRYTHVGWHSHPTLMHCGPLVLELAESHRERLRRGNLVTVHNRATVDRYSGSDAIGRFETILLMPLRGGDRALGGVLAVYCMTPGKRLAAPMEHIATYSRRRPVGCSPGWPRPPRSSATRTRIRSHSSPTGAATRTRSIDSYLAIRS